MVTTSRDDDGDPPTTEVIHVTLSQVSTFGCARPLSERCTSFGPIHWSPADEFILLEVCSSTSVLRSYMRINATTEKVNSTNADLNIAVLLDPADFENMFD